MADVKLSNTATIVGNYDAIPTTLDIGYKICMIVIEKQTRKKYKIRLKL